jgi:hypothetical protein
MTKGKERSKGNRLKANGNKKIENKRQEKI